MAVAENAGARIGSSNQSLDNITVTSNSTTVENQKPRNDPEVLSLESNFHLNGGDRGHLQQIGVANTVSVGPNNYKVPMGQMQNGYEANGVKSPQMVVRSNDMSNGEDGDNSFKRDMRDLEELLSKLNPMAEEFVPPSLAKNLHGYLTDGGFGFSNNLLLQTNSGNANGNINRRKNGFSQGRRRMNYKMTAAQRDEMTRRTVYVSDIDQQVTEEQLAALFLNCGQVVDCRICGDPNSILHFAFIEFTDDGTFTSLYRANYGYVSYIPCVTPGILTEGARAALNLSGTMLGYYPVRVLPSKTAIAPVNPEFLPRSADEREMCSRTIYCTNIDKKVTQAEVKLFFESLCGEVQRLRLLGDYHHSTRIAFVEFTMAESAIAALNCSGVVLGALPIRVSPSKTPVRPRSPRPQMH